MITIPPISIKHGNKQYIFYPRVELITGCISNKNSIYEILCQVMDGQLKLSPVEVFNELDNSEIYIIYHHILSNINMKTTATISLNVDIEFLNTYYLEILLSEFIDHMLILELTENNTLKSIIQSKGRLNKIREDFGVQIWLDDFGVGYSNFDLVSAFNFDGLKISKELFWDLYRNDKILLKHIIKFMKSKVNIIVIEGVDSFDKYNFCKEQLCMMQGYFLNEVRNNVLNEVRNNVTI